MVLHAWYSKAVSGEKLHLGFIPIIVVLLCVIRSLLSQGNLNKVVFQHTHKHTHTCFQTKCSFGHSSGAHLDLEEKIKVKIWIFVTKLPAFKSLSVMYSVDLSLPIDIYLDFI